MLEKWTTEYGVPVLQHDGINWIWKHFRSEADARTWFKAKFGREPAHHGIIPPVKREHGLETDKYWSISLHRPQSIW